MALYTSNLISTPVIPPAKSNNLILRTASLILGRRSPAPSSPTLSVKPICQSAFANPLRASPPRQYVYPDPIPEFAEAETQKFRAELLRKLLKDKDTFGDELDAVIDVCAEIFSEFLLKDYGGPGTLLVEPFTNMLVAIKDKKLPGAPFAARAALLWAQNYVDQDWEVWNSKLTM
ncbi:protein PLASTID REDOX INSENSITIVE 2, chloroplastic-like isoform X1 [Corylus avellana]|uniref:protein PLASTID REDOX INSENSITIVE 2, chloroplastic-like isoform X1 n=1 Tax=Corylus avellana TaxID=13451 RepID=UPI00286B9EAA|nr:protein PLASTID REDOX INSENSITIVE 2, chloroplastic-like isoform X1 [Corylus avellana]